MELFARYLAAKNGGFEIFSLLPWHGMAYPFSPLVADTKTRYVLPGDHAFFLSSRPGYHATRTPRKDDPIYKYVIIAQHSSRILSTLH
ncbi:hypothetical protein N7457_007653 [Penicillium paradoxum]|uniref:uncharacterized protein n=1 Tax=Penicillium paradoxum TaxID=176176 RepID=UPI002546935C|nr:uncharacterized protein N7457_007653 [Penicillium paradoxum]KAJ5772757.1 hypothetical protein N7457_007653 [Penicillium paradoxum]